jgi:hypothetical protein
MFSSRLRWEPLSLVPSLSNAERRRKWSSASGRRCSRSTPHLDGSGTSKERPATLEVGLDRLHQWAQGRYDRLVGEILHDLRIFARTNTLMFLLAFIGAYSAKAPPRVLTIVSAALSAAAVVGTVLYVRASRRRIRELSRGCNQCHQPLTAGCPTKPCRRTTLRAAAER